MKRIFMSILISLAFFGMMKAQDGGRDWLKRYKIDPMNSNPVFTRPTHERDEARVQGAGICMNDGLAYNRTYYNFGSDWHYEPKLHLCQEEEAVLDKIFGKFVPERGRFYYQLLKYGVIPTDYGAIVAYRLWDDEYPGDGQCVRHFYATFDHKGNLLDAIYIGHHDWLNEILKAEPHGNYTPRENFGGGSMQFTEDGKTLTKEDYYYFKTPDDKSDKWEDTTVFNISDKGLFSLVSHKEKGKPQVNPVAEELHDLELLPLSDKDAIQKWNAFLKKNAKNEQLKERINYDVLYLFITRQKEYMEWAYKNQKESVLVSALAPAVEIVSRKYGDGTTQHLMANSLDLFENDKPVQNYWRNRRFVKSLFGGD